MHCQAWGNRIDAHTATTSLDGCAAGEGHHASLRSGIVSLPSLGSPAQHRGVVHDDALASWIHVVESGAHTAEGAVEGDVEHGAPLAIGHFVQFGGAAKASVVDEYIDATEVCGGSIDERLHGLFVRDIARNAEHAKFFGRLGTTTLVLIADDNRGAFFDAALRRGEANTGASRSGDEHRLAHQ